MERKFYTDDFEQLLKEKSDEFRMYPSKRVWHSIYNDLHPGRKWPSIAVSMVLIIALLMVGYWNNNFSKTTIAAGNTTKNAAPHINASANDNAAISSTLLPPNTGFATTAFSASSSKNTGANQTEINNNPKNYLASTGIVLNTIPGSNGYNAAISKQPAAESDIALQNGAVPNTSFNNPQQSANNAKANLNAGLENILPTVTFLNNTQQNNIKTTVSAGINPGNIAAADAGQTLNNNRNDITDATGTVKTESINKDRDQAVANKENKVAKPAATTITATDKKLLSANDDKAWIEDYAFHNKSKRKKWQDRTSLELYITPSAGYRNLTNAAKYNTIVPASPLSGASVSSVDANKSVNQTPGLGLEAGFGITYSVAKNLRIKAGIQANYTNYGINAEETNHPVLTTLLMVDPYGNNYIKPITSTLANTTGAQTIKVHSQTYQFSIPIGVALKLSGNKKLEWYAGASLQPTAIIGSKSYLISADRKNYVEDPSLMRRWNLNAGFETYINYKLDGFTLQVGPQFRYQLLSTYNNTYTVKENLYNLGLKIGILKSF